jgi:hypothetical protein
MRVAKDPVTGQWRAVTPDEAKALARPRQGRRPARCGWQVAALAEGACSQGRDPGAEHLSSMRVAKDAQGHLVEECVEGDEAPMAVPTSQTQQREAEIE